MTAVTVTAVAFGVALLLLALSVMPALQARADRTAWMDAPPGAALAQDSASLYTTLDTTADHYEGHFIDVVALAGSGPGAPMPPGVTALPAAGEALVSPALADLIRSAPALVGRYGDVVGTVSNEALSGPNHLLAVRGMSAGEGSSFGVPLAEFPEHGELLQFTGIIRLVILIGGVAMLAPVALFVAMTSRLAAASRDRRLAALRLAGATTGEVAQLAAVESMVGGIGGVAAGTALFFLVRPLATHVTYDGGRWFASDITPGVLGFSIVVIGVPLVTAVAAQATLAKVAHSPLGVSRRAAPRPVRAWRVLPLAAAIPLLGFVLASGSALQAARGHGRLVVLAFLVLLVALVFAGPWFTRAVGLLLARSGGPARLLAGRRLADDPRTGFRAIAGVIVAILVTTMFVATTPAAAESLRSTKIIGQQSGSGQAAIFHSSPVQSSRLLDEVRAVAGISSAALVYTGSVQSGDDPAEVWIGDCAEIARAARLAPIPCGAAPVIVADNRQSIAPGAGEPITIVSLEAADTSVPSEPIEEDISTLTIHADAIATMPAQTGVGAPGLIVSPEAMGSRLSALRPTLMVLRYENQAALERARTLVLRHVPGGSVSTRETAYEGYSSDVRRFYRVLNVATLGVFVVAGCSLVAAAAIGLFERRRPFALLRAAGTPLRTLRRTVFLEAAAPLAVTSILATLLGVLVGRWTVQSSGQSHSLPWLGISAPIAISVLVSLLVVAGATSMVGRATSTDETRFE